MSSPSRVFSIRSKGLCKKGYTLFKKLGVKVAVLVDPSDAPALGQVQGFASHTPEVWPELYSFLQSTGISGDNIYGPDYYETVRDRFGSQTQRDDASYTSSFTSGSSSSTAMSSVELSTATSAAGSSAPAASGATAPLPESTVPRASNAAALRPVAATGGLPPLRLYGVDEEGFESPFDLSPLHETASRSEYRLPSPIMEMAPPPHCFAAPSPPVRPGTPIVGAGNGLSHVSPDWRGAVGDYLSAPIIPPSMPNVSMAQKRKRSSPSSEGHNKKRKMVTRSQRRPRIH